MPSNGEGKKESAYFCPGLDLSLRSNVSYYTTYPRNCRQWTSDNSSGGASNYKFPIRSDRVRNPSDIILHFEGFGWGGLANPAVYAAAVYGDWQYGYHIRNQISILMWDGHAEGRTYRIPPPYYGYNGKASWGNNLFN